ncbi:BRO-N domain-containing protein [Anaerophilus nitritogenes]|uniref:BRO-N domain-containing protein n=1 Tax=Anaerophilus nitritogenes TaxID=2498136 RepID=UPI001FAA94EE|nr:Bro-N domain-containing protein [Anaerophilus nitritogenes]
MNNLQIVDQRNLLGKDFKMYGDFQNPLFLGLDVAAWIEYAKTGKGSYDVSKMLNTVDEDEKVLRRIFVSGQMREMWFLTEDGLYEVLMQSRKPIAKKFKKEVKKILKSIRTNGMYIAQTKIQEKMFNTMKVEMTGLVDEIVSNKINQIEEKCSQYFRPVSKEKYNISQYIKKRLGIEKADEEYELVKQRVLIKLGGEKWEDIPVETLVNSLNVIDESIKIIKADRKVNQLSIFEKEVI